MILRAVDEKLFAMGAAVTYDPLPILYEREPSGILRLTATHQAPGGGTEGEGGAAGGGGDEGLRSDFVDTLAFRQVRTDRQGRATVALPLSDDLTSWHLSATAVTSTLRRRRGPAAACRWACPSSSRRRSPTSTSSPTDRRSGCEPTATACRPGTR